MLKQSVNPDLSGKKVMLITVMLCLFFVSGVIAQSPGDTLWTRTYGGSHQDIGRSLDYTNDGGYIIGGRTQSFPWPQTNFYMIRTDANGDTVWTKGFCSSDGAMSVAATNDGGFVITGKVYVGGGDFCLVKTDGDGNILWTQYYGGTGEECSYCVKQTSDNGYILSGYTPSFGVGGPDWYVVKTDGAGNELWSRTFGTPGSHFEIAEFVEQIPEDDGYIVAGYIGPWGSQELYAVRLNAEGDTLWTKTYGGSANDAARCVDLTSDGGFIFAGETRSFGSHNASAWLVKTDSNGNVEWDQIYGDNAWNNAQYVRQTDDGGFIFSGGSGSAGSSMQVFVGKTDALGNTSWINTYGIAGSYNGGYCVRPTSDNNYIVAGYSASEGAGGGDVYVLKLVGEHIIGDFNDDGYVDATDLQMFGDHWHFVDTDPSWDALYDLVPDGIIDAADLQVFGDHWHEGTPPKSGSGGSGKGPNENAGIVFDLNATTYGNQNLTSIPSQPAGTYIRVDVYCTGVQNLDTYEFEVIYDSTELEYVTATATNPITYEPNILTTNGGTALGWMIDSSTPGVLSIAYTLAGTDPAQAPEGEGLIADIVFQVSSSIEDSLTFGDVYFYDSFGIKDVIIDKGIAIIPGAVSIDNADTVMDSSIILHQNYPNPFKFQTTIAYETKGRKKADDVEIRIYNIAGQLIDTIEGKYGIAKWDSGNLPTGIYFYQIMTENCNKVKKMMVIK